MSPGTSIIPGPRPLLAILLMAGGIVVFVFAALASAYGLRQTRELTELQTRRLHELAQIETVLSELKDLETGQRGFLITGDESFLEPYVAARSKLEASFPALQAVLRDMRLPDGFRERLEALVGSRIRSAEQNVERRRRGAFEAADLRPVAEGKLLMDQIRNEFGVLSGQRRAELGGLSRKLERGQHLAFGVTFGAGVLGLVLMTSALGLFLWEQRRRLNAEAVLASANQRLEAQVEARTRDLTAALARIRAFAGELDQSVEAERRRLAREVHDQIGQIFTAMKLLIRPWMQRFASEPDMQQHFEEFIRLLDEGVTTARRITAELHPPLLEDLGLGAALEHYVGKYCAPGKLGCRVEVHQDEVLDRTLAMTLFRIAQEALTNTLRHAEASRVVIEGGLEDAHYRLRIEDDGRGPARDAEPSFGMRGMEERARLVGGTLKWSARPEGGFVVEAAVPVAPKNPEESA